MRHPRQLSAARTAVVLVTATALIASGLTVSAGRPAHAAALSATLPQQDVVTRLTAGPAAPNSISAAPQIGVRVGASLYTASWARYTAQTCPVAVWLVVLDRATLAPLFNTAGTHGLIGDPCTGDIAAQVAQIRAFPGAPLVILNTLYTANCGNQVFGSLAADLAPLGFSNQLGTVNLCAVTVTGLGSPGTPAGQAWERPGAVSYDAVPTASPAAPLATATALQGSMAANLDNQYRFLNWDTGLVQRYGGDGPGGWTVTDAGGATSYPAADYPGQASSVPPAGRGGVQVLVGNTTDTGVHYGSNTFWTNTGVAATDAHAWSVLTTFVAGNNQPDRFVLLRNVGSARAAPITSASDPSMSFARLMDSVGGLYDAWVQLRATQNVTLVLPGGTPLNLTPKARDALGGPQVTTLMTTVSDGAGDDPRAATVLLTRTPHDAVYQPAVVTAGTAAQGAAPTPQPGQFAVQRLLSQPSRPWPDTQTTGGRAAYAWWSQALCSCADARAMYVTGATGGWTSTLQAATYPGSTTFTAQDWASTRTDLLNELGWANTVYDSERSALDFNQAVLGEGGTALTSAWAATLAALDANDVFKQRANNSLRVSSGVLTMLLLLGELIPLPVARALVGLAVAVWFGVLAFYQAQHELMDARLDSTVGSVAQDLVTRMLGDGTLIGIQYQRIFDDHDRLAAAAAAIGAGVPGWRQLPDPGAAAQAVQAQLRVGFYRAVLPSVYEEVTSRNAVTGDVSSWGTMTFSTGLGDPRVYRPFVNYATSPDSALAVVGPTSGSYLAALGAAPLWTSGHEGDDKLFPLPEQIFADLSAAGVWRPVLFRSWPFRHVDCDAVSQPYLGYCYRAAAASPG